MKLKIYLLLDNIDEKKVLHSLKLATKLSQRGNHFHHLLLETVLGNWQGLGGLLACIFKHRSDRLHFVRRYSQR